MINLDEVIARWSAAFSGQADVPGLATMQLEAIGQRTEGAFGPSSMEIHVRLVAAMVAEIRERRKLHDQALEDLHGLVRLVAELRAYGKARLEVAEAFDAWFVGGVGREGGERRSQRLASARAAHRSALDRIEALAVQLAGGAVGRICEGQVSRGQ